MRRITGSLIASCRAEPDRLAGGGVAIAGFALALPVAVLIGSHLTFHHHPTGIVGAISVLHYPKQQDLYLFAAALVFVPLFSLGIVAVWLVLSRVLPNGLARFDAVGHAPLALAIAAFWKPPAQASSWVVLVVLASLALRGILVGVAWWSRRAQPSRIRELPPAYDVASRSPRRARCRMLVHGVIVLVIYAAAHDPGRVHGELDPFHEGERLAPLNDLLRGKIPFRDFYLQHGLLEDAYVPLLASKLFDVSLASVRRIEEMLRPLGLVATYLLAVQVLRLPFAALIVVFLTALQVSWFGSRHAPGLMALALAARAIASLLDARCVRAVSLEWLAAGCLTALAIANSLDVGLYTAAACGSYLIVFLLTARERPLRLRGRLLAAYGGGRHAGRGRRCSRSTSPKLVLASDRGPRGLTTTERLPIIAAYVKQHYLAARVIAGVTILVRKADATGG
ncbi:MAG: hypothetical protein U1E76_16875 [Planctomycetota bacterium]